MRLLTAALLLLSLAAEGREVLTTVVRGPDRLVTGAPAALSIIAERSTSPDDRGPWPGARLSLSIAGKGKSQVLYAGGADERGQAQARFTAPAWPDGEYTLVLAASARGREQVSRFQVQLVSNGKVLLQSDKPLYQPGQTMHLRALALRPQDMKPLGGAEVQFEVHDARDNRVFIEKRTTSAFGIAAADFEVGPEAMLGAYRAKALVPAGGAPAAELELKVERYSLPKFKVSLEPDRTWYRFGEKVTVGLEARYFFGKPVAGAEVKVLLSSGKGEGLGEELERATAKTDAEGRASVTLTAPPAPAEGDERTLTVVAVVTDVTGHSEKASRAVVAARRGLRVELVPESKELIVGVNNRLWVLTARPDGSPLQGAEVELTAPGLSAPLRGKSDELGIAQLEYLPRVAPSRCADLVATVGREGERVTVSRCLPVRASGPCAVSGILAGASHRGACNAGPLRLRADRARNPAGAPNH
ncbi:MAG: MG2 domain-containing protein, partial [Myxococcaceae bacterium]